MSGAATMVIRADTTASVRTLTLAIRIPVMMFAATPITTWGRKRRELWRAERPSTFWKLERLAADGLIRFDGLTIKL
jgi:hypothetical protein